MRRNTTGLSVERQIERAWRQHDPSRSRIPFPVWRRLEIFKRELIEPAALAVKHVAMPELLLAEAIKRRGMARQRALK